MPRRQPVQQVMRMVAHVRLCHSRMMFVRAYPRETQEMVSTPTSGPSRLALFVAWVDVIGLPSASTIRPANRLGASAPTANEGGKL